MVEYHYRKRKDIKIKGGIFVSIYKVKRILKKISFPDILPYITSRPNKVTLSKSNNWNDYSPKILKRLKDYYLTVTKRDWKV